MLKTDPRTETHTCCLCGATFTGLGNNPDPLDCKEDDRCCDDCNANVVIPARLGHATWRDPNGRQRTFIRLSGQMKPTFDAMYLAVMPDGTTLHFVEQDRAEETLGWALAAARYRHDVRPKGPRWEILASFATADEAQAEQAALVDKHGPEIMLNKTPHSMDSLCIVPLGKVQWQSASAEKLAMSRYKPSN